MKPSKYQQDLIEELAVIEQFLRERNVSGDTFIKALEIYKATAADRIAECLEELNDTIERKFPNKVRVKSVAE